MLSSTNDFGRRHSFIRGTTIKSVNYVFVMGNIGSYGPYFGGEIKRSGFPDKIDLLSAQPSLRGGDGFLARHGTQCPREITLRDPVSIRQVKARRHDEHRADNRYRQ